jgi:hypothetical protein
MPQGHSVLSHLVPCQYQLYRAEGFFRCQQLLSPGQQIPRILWKPEVHHRVHSKAAIGSSLEPDILPSMSRNSSVGIVTSRVSEEFWLHSLQGDPIYFFHSVQTGSLAHHVSYSISTGVLSHGHKVVDA